MNAIIELKAEMDSESNAAAMKDGVLHLFRPAEGKLPYRCEMYRLTNTHKPFKTIEYKNDKVKYNVEIVTHFKFVVDVDAESERDAMDRVKAVMDKMRTADLRDSNRQNIFLNSGVVCQNTTKPNTDFSIECISKELVRK